MLFSIARIIFASLLLLPVLFAWAGGLRFYSGISQGIALLVSVPLFVFLIYKEGSKLYLKSPAQVILCSLTFAYFLARLYNSELGALVSFGCADAANHLRHYRDFIGQDPKIYNGFNALYAAWWFFEDILGLELLTALALTLTLPLFCIAYLIALFSPTLKAKRSQILQFVIFCFGLVTISEACILPLLHYNQADGYLAHFFSICAFLILIFFGENLTFVSLAAIVIACRFSYGLQLPDLFFAASLLFAIKAIRADSPVLIKGYALSSAAFILSASLGLLKLIEAFSLSGSILSQNLDSAFAAQIAGIALLIVCGLKNSFELWFLVAISFTQGFWLATTHESDYYFSKLFLYSSLALAIIALREVNRLFSANVSLRTMSWIMLVTFLVVAQRPYLPSYLERSLPNGSYTLIAPQLDLKVKEIVDEVLARENKTFFRYVTSRWAQYSFFNYLYQAEGTFDSFTAPPKNLVSHSCIFWSNNSNDIPRLAKYPAPQTAQWLALMNQRSDAKVIRYQVDWAGRQTVKYLCSQDQEISLQ